jgi:putative nucleotidyltransferase with HDIG domain
MDGGQLIMGPRVKAYVYGVVLTAVIAMVWVYLQASVVPRVLLADAFVLSALAIAGDMLALVLPSQAVGSVGFVPYFASAVLIPAWPSVAIATVIRLGFELRSDRAVLKKAFNVACQCLMLSVVVLTYNALGGTSLLSLAGKVSLAAITRQNGFAALAAFTVAFFLNNSLVFGVIAISTGKPLKTMIIHGSRVVMILNLIVSPIVFVFAWVFATFGSIAAAALWVPILGLRQFHVVNLELEKTNEELLELMVKSIEARDAYTSGHSRRVNHYSTIIARAIGLHEREVEDVGRAALLHDVGKIHEKYAKVLSKEDRLTPDEWTLIKDHPVDGANLVATMSRLRELVPAVRGHHENWDGTGYPDGLAGQMIPLAARIIRFADTIDAMTTERPYRAPLTEAQVRAELVHCRGSQFDPTICDRLLSSALWPTLFSPPASSSEIAARRNLAVVPAGSRGRPSKPVARRA